MAVRRHLELQEPVTYARMHPWIFWTLTSFRFKWHITHLPITKTATEAVFCTKCSPTVQYCLGIHFIFLKLNDSSSRSRNWMMITIINWFVYIFCCVGRIKIYLLYTSQSAKKRNWIICDSEELKIHLVMHRMKLSKKSTVFKVMALNRHRP